MSHFVAFLDRKQIADSLHDELGNNVLVAIATQVIEADWVEGVALRFGHDKLSPADAQEKLPMRLEVEWPLLSRDPPSRERSLWLKLFETLVVDPGTGDTPAFETLWSELVKRLHKKIRIVIHYKLRASLSERNKDKILVQNLAARWAEFLNMLDAPVTGRIVLLFSINSDQEPVTGWRAWLADKPIELAEIHAGLDEKLPRGSVMPEQSRRCCVIDGGELSSIVAGDTETWKAKVKKADISESHSDTIITAVEDNIPDEGIRHRDLVKAVKQDTKIRSLFKIT